MHFMHSPTFLYDMVCMMHYITCTNSSWLCYMVSGSWSLWLMCNVTLLACLYTIYFIMFTKPWEAWELISWNKIMVSTQVSSIWIQNINQETTLTISHTQCLMPSLFLEDDENWVLNQTRNCAWHSSLQ
jgi:hypothetical protein